MLKMVDQKQFDLYVVLTIILCGNNFLFGKI